MSTLKRKLELQNLLQKWERRLAQLFVQWSRDQQAMPIAQIERFLDANDIEGLITALSLKPKRLDSALALIAIEAGTMAAEHLKGMGGFVNKADRPKPQLRRSPTFAITRGNAANKLREQTDSLIQQMDKAQRDTIYQAIADGVEANKKTRLIAVDIKKSLPLTSKQHRAVGNFEFMLRTNSKEALSRKLRDKRFDPSLKGDKVLTSKQIDKMVDGYRRKMIAHRAKTIATTEAHAAINWARDENAKQNNQDNDIIRTWISRRDKDVRDSHDAIDGQKRRIDEPFESPNGSKLLAPGDTSLGAGAGEVINCRCFVDYSAG